jgi:hypothetical protein
MPSCTGCTRMGVTRASSSGRRLSLAGSRCWTRTKAKPGSAGSPCNSWVKASKPPAEAPIPTIGNKASAGGWGPFGTGEGGSGGASFVIDNLQAAGDEPAGRRAGATALRPSRRGHAIQYAPQGAVSSAGPTYRPAGQHSYGFDRPRSWVLNQRHASARHPRMARAGTGGATAVGRHRIRRSL